MKKKDHSKNAHSNHSMKGKEAAVVKDTSAKEGAQKGLKEREEGLVLHNKPLNHLLLKLAIKHDRLRVKNFDPSFHHFDRCDIIQNPLLYFEDVQPFLALVNCRVVQQKLQHIYKLKI